ncbi:MAG: spermidine synthase [Chloroflexi bacterium]|nr:MAG: spermidine synthase [Chloroflexota bacterium]
MGIACFSVIAYFALPPLVWFLMLTLIILVLSSRQTVLFAASTFLISLIIVVQLQLNAYWSPYYKILLHPLPQGGYIVDVNNAGGHQAMVPWQYKEPFYRRVYELFQGGSFKHAMILGAGSGSDVSTALVYGVKSVTAVEIDPTIQQLGARFNPDQPYSDPRVKVVINDGRSFLQNDKGKYDLIIFALPDSLTLTSSNTSLRLESFLLTEESIRAARARLTNDGLVVFYNFYREDWLVQKLANMAGHAFNQQPLVSTYGGWGRAATIMVGPRLKTLPAGMFGAYHETASSSKDLRVIGEGYYPLTNGTMATDDWPFLYLRDHSFPLIYVFGLLMVAFYALGGTLLLAPRKTLRRFDWHMFFLGVAFMVLEVKSLTTFSLLFGSTWFVNSLVFFAILSSVLLAVLVNSRLKIRRIGIWYLLLFGVLVLNLFLPPEALLLGNPIARYLLASILAFTPVFLANIIFANSFRDSETADISFASNLLGIMVGGGLEYFSMLYGYHWLLVLVIIFYACALLLRRRRTGKGGTTSEGAPLSAPVDSLTG